MTRTTKTNKRKTKVNRKPKSLRRRKTSTRKVRRSDSGLNLIAKAILVLLVAHLLVFGFTACAILSYKVINPPSTSLAIYRKIFNAVKNRPIRFVPIKNIPQDVQYSIIRLEDPTFRKHHGLDIRAMRMAYRLNRRYKKKIAGGSTITQQLARTLFLTPHKSYLRKYMELIIALQLELMLSKDRILELYFNYVEFGRGIYGIGSASRFHYGRSFYSLSHDEMKKLIIILPSPLRHTVNDIDSKRAFIRRQHILTRPQPQIITPSTGPVVEEDD